MTLRRAEARFSTLGNRTWITYPEFASNGIVHGIVVFKEAHHTIPFESWTGTASAFVLKHLPPEAGIERMMIPCQVHGSEVTVVGRGYATEHGSSPESDALVTDVAGLAIGVSVADCIPLVAANEAARVVGVAHCGWRGIAAGVVERFAEAVHAGGNAGETAYLVGPGIGPCCYEVREDLLGQFPAGEVRRFARRAGGSAFFDLKMVVASRLVGSGADPARISIDNTCTACQKYVLSSFRRHGARCGRMLAFVAIAG